ncbi:MAG: glycosyltransferase [Deltaproteobacteria bacterium]|nr:glycosyltransferase [Deltaproteobacteria bacterium]
MPLVATDVRGCREIVRNGVNGFLVPPKDPERLAQALATLLQNRGLRQKMGKAGE